MQVVQAAHGAPLGEIDDWTSQIGETVRRSPAMVTITSSLYLLVKWEDVTPAQFVCKGDAGTKEFKLSDAPSHRPCCD